TILRGLTTRFSLRSLNRSFAVMAEMKKIGTHSGKFHCDEAFACYMLKQLPEFENHQIVRSRDEKVLAECDIVVDVGGVFDAASRRFDHHQKEFQETMSTLGHLPFHTRLSSAGLVYAHYGKQIIANYLKKPIDDKLVSLFFHRLYSVYVEQVDAVDNGISAYEGLPKYHTSGGISGRVGHLNPHWNEKDVDADERFGQAMNLVGGDFMENLRYLYQVWWPAREIVEKAIDSRTETDSSGRVIVLRSNGGVPWKEHFFDLEDELGLSSANITYIVFGEGNDWRVQAIPNTRLSSFDNRQPLPWKGLRDDALSTESGIEGGVFVHVTGFIGGNRSKEGAIAMASKAIQLGNQDAETEVKKMKLEEQPTSVQA
ncbi:hypothetical protein PFISCL1PPCAC_1825, partial [Pristionchus fissidentatus]